MSIEQSIQRVRPLLLAGLAALALAAGCTQEPTAPAFDNPLDPDGPVQGDPWGLSANYAGNGVIVKWTGLDMPGIFGYEILHSLVAAGPFSIAGSVDAGLFTYLHTDYAPNRDNYYKVRAVDVLGAGSAISGVQAAGVLAPPFLGIGESATTASRKVDLLVRADVGDSAEVAATADFANAVTTVLDENGEATLLWDLGPADSNGVIKHVYLRVYTGGVASEAWDGSVEVEFEPALSIEGNPQRVARRNPPLVIDGPGVTEMRFAADPRDLPVADWVPGDAVYVDYFLDAAPDSQTIYGEFACDFGFTAVDSFTAVPDSLLDATLQINGGVEATSDLDLTLQLDAVATQMRFAESVGELALTGWQDYAATASLTHGGCGGDLLKTVYGQFRNDWFDSDVVSDTIQWLPPEVLDVTMAVADTLAGGVALTVTGTAVAGTCGDPLDGVEFNDGGGWIAATGLEDWSVAWTPPAVVENTPVTLIARVLAGAEADTVTVEVVVAP
ncbi:hypothetical protein H8E07_11795 [bacterium]|nr:hypothetical protein [bacterium]